MNAPDRDIQSYQILFTAKLAPSPTNPRKHFDEAAHAQMVESVLAHGILEPILVRPLAGRKSTGVEWEIVAGERRWRAATTAQLQAVPCIVRELDDLTVLKIQIIENLQREDLNALEEAAGYFRLKNDHGYSADAIAAEVGKSKAYVYARLKLTDLAVEARQALDAGRIDFSKALLLARLPGKLQTKALNLVLSEGNHYSYQRLVRKLRDGFMVSLSQAPFDLADDRTGAQIGRKHLDMHGDCNGCPHRSGNDAELLESLQGVADVCTDKTCYDHKVAWFWFNKRTAAEAEGRTVLTGDEARAAIPAKYCDTSANYLNLDAECDSIQFPEKEPELTGDEAVDEAAMDAYYEREEAYRPPTYRELLRDAGLPTVLAESGKGNLIELAPVKEAAKALKAKGVKLHVSRHSPIAQDEPEDRQDRAEQERKQRERQERESEFRRRVFAQVAEKWKGPLKRDDLSAIAAKFADDYGTPDAIEELYGEDLGRIADGTEAELSRFLVLYLLANDVEDYGAPKALLAMAKRLRIDPDKIKKEIAAEAKAAATAAKAETAGEDAAAAAKKKAPKK